MYDENGLLPTTYVTAENGRFYFDGDEVFVAPECRGVIDYLCQDKSLWSIARLRFNCSDIRQKRAPIIGVSFGQALRQAYESTSGLQKSMFQVPEWTKYQGKAVIATMLAHTSATSDSVKFEAWQFLDISDETFYMHAIIDKASKSVAHLDAATMAHTKDQRAEIMAKARKIEGGSYTKHFRLDGRFSVTEAEKLMNLYFPVEPLTLEFLDAFG